MSEKKETPKKVEQKASKPKSKKAQGKQRKGNGFGYVFINTKYGKRIKLVQGSNTIWLREEDLYAILRELVSRAFKYQPPKTEPYD